MQTLFQDVRYAIRLLKRSPGFAATAVLTLAVAIGANAAILSAVQGVLIAPLPYPDPDRLVRLFEETPTTPHFPMAPGDFRDYRAELRTVDGIAAYPLLLVCTYRSGYSPAWHERPAHQRIALDPLSAEQAMQLVRDRLGGADHSSVGAALVNRAAGNPFSSRS